MYIYVCMYVSTHVCIPCCYDTLFVSCRQKSYQQHLDLNSVNVPEKLQQPVYLLPFHRLENQGQKDQETCVRLPTFQNHVSELRCIQLQIPRLLHVTPKPLPWGYRGRNVSFHPHKEPGPCAKVTLRMGRSFIHSSIEQIVLMRVHHDPGATSGSGQNRWITERTRPWSLQLSGGCQAQNQETNK